MKTMLKVCIFEEEDLSANKYITTLFTKGRDKDLRKNNAIQKEIKEREWQPLINSECTIKQFNLVHPKGK